MTHAVGITIGVFLKLGTYRQTWTTVVTRTYECQNAEEVRASGMMKMADELLRPTGTKQSTL